MLFSLKHMQFRPVLSKEALVPRQGAAPVHALPARFNDGISRARSWAAGELRVSAETWRLRLSTRVWTLVSQTREPNLVDAASFAGGSMGSPLINVRHLLENFGG